MVVNLTYQNEIHTADDLTLSVDMITADYSIGNPQSRDELVKLLDELPIRYSVKVIVWESFKMGRFRANYKIETADGASFYIGIALNAAKTLWPRCRFEYNPNKVAHHTVFLALLRWVNAHSRRMHRSVRRFDLAVDIPIDRASVRLIKDRRVYTERRHGEEWTEYLGPKASTVGRCKLYNKTAEAKLSYPLTRLELTLDPEIPYEEIAWPKVYYIDNRQVEFDELQALTDTQRFILGALMEGYGSLNDLGRRTKEKLLAYMEGYCRWVTVSKADYNKILYQLKAYMEYPALPLNVDEVSADQPPRPQEQLPAWIAEAEKGHIDPLAI